MNVSVANPGSQVYVEISSQIAAQLQNIASSRNVEDVHICGTCKRSFSDINLFVEHKRAGCQATTQKVLPPSTVTPQSSALGYVSTSTTNVSDGSISPLGSQYLRVIFDGGNLHMEQNQSHEAHLKSTLQCEETTEPQILQTRLLGKAESEISGNGFQNNSEVHSVVLPHKQQHSSCKREFQIDEEDVATLLANQLASEVVNTVDFTVSSKTGFIDIVSDERETLDLGHMGLSAASDGLVTHSKEGQTGLVPQRKVSHISRSNAADGERGWHQKSKDAEVSCSSAIVRTTTAVCVAPSSPVVLSESSAITSNMISSDSSSTSSSNNANGTVAPVVDGPRGKRKHECTHHSCSFKTWYLKDLIRHERKHTGERPFECDVCSQSFSRVDKLRMHQRIHSGEKRFRCEHCEYATHDSGSLRKHMRIHNDERPYKCQMCPYRSRDSSQLTVHLRTHTGDNPFVCTFGDCSSAFKTSSDLKRHTRIHTGERPYACSFCGYKCAIKSNLKVHIKLNHSDGKPVACSSCTFVGTSRREVKEHEKLHAGEVLKCGLCSFTCISVSAMNTHQKSHTDETYFACKVCSFVGRQSVHLKAHMKKKHPEAARNMKREKKEKGNGKDSAGDKQLATVRSASAKATKPFCIKAHKCSECDAAFVREDSWRSHMRQHKNTLLNKRPLASAASVVSSPTKTASVPVESCESVEVTAISQNQDTVQQQKDDLTEDFLILNPDDSTSKANGDHVDKSNCETTVASSENAEASFVHYTMKDKSDKVDLSVVSQLNQEILDGSGLQAQPILLYVQNAPVLTADLDGGLRSAEILASINQPTPILLAGRCGNQFIQVPLDQSASVVDQFSSPVQQFILSTPLESVVGGNTTYLHQVEATENSGSTLSVVSLRVDKDVTVSTDDGSQ